MTRARRARAEGPICGRAQKSGRRPPARGSTADARAARGARQPVEREPARGVAHVRARGETAGRRRGGARGASRSDAGVARRRRRADARDHKFLTVREARRTAMRLASRARRRGPREALRVCGPSARDARVALSCGAGSDARSPESTRVRIPQTRLPAARGGRPGADFLFNMDGFFKTNKTYKNYQKKTQVFFMRLAFFLLFRRACSRARARSRHNPGRVSRFQGARPSASSHRTRAASTPTRPRSSPPFVAFGPAASPRAPRCAICAPKTKVASSNPSIARESPGAPRARTRDGSAMRARSRRRSQPVDRARDPRPSR